MVIQNWIKHRIDYFYIIFMGQKTNPIRIRIGITHQPRSSWYAKKSEYSFFVGEDYHIRKYIFQTRHNCIISAIEIDRQGIGVRVRISSSQIRPLVGSEGKSLEKLRSELKRACRDFRINYFNFSSLRKNWNQNEKIEIQIFVRKLLCSESDASYLSGFIAAEIAKRVPFRRVFRLAQTRAQSFDKVLGIRLQISGRLGGAEIARTEWIRSGCVPLHTLSAYLDYSQKDVKTIYGLLGIKVWIFRPINHELK
jgi:small subunit ribosomal protein S3